MDMNLFLLVIYLILNIFAFVYFGSDKDKARNGEYRIPERNLLIAAFFGPWGAFLGMRYFHHKTKKTKFKAVYGFMLIHVALILALFLF